MMHLYTIMRNDNFIAERKGRPAPSPWRKITAGVHEKSDESEAASWLIFRSIRCAVLHTELLVGKDLDVFQATMDVKYSCIKVDEMLSQSASCNISILISLGELEFLRHEVNPFEDATRPLNIEKESCSVSPVIPDIKVGTKRIIKVSVDCKNLKSHESSRTLVVVLANSANIKTVIASWIGEAETGLFGCPYQVLIVASVFEAALAEEEIYHHISGATMCVKIVHTHLGLNEVRLKEPSIVCPNGYSRNESDTKIVFFIAVVDKGRACTLVNNSAYAGTDQLRGDAAATCFVAEGLRAAGLLVDQSKAFDYVLLQGEGFAICKGSMSNLIQGALALRRAFSVIRCGLWASCLLVNGNDVAYWSKALASEASSGASADTIIFHRAHGLSRRGQQRFKDARILVTKETLVKAPVTPLKTNAVRAQCGESMSKDSSSFPHPAHDDEMYLESSGCLPTIDLLSPCQDKHKSIDFLLRPHWIRRVKVPDFSISVQVLTNDRPSILFRTVSTLVEQTRPECITIHVDGVNDDSMSDHQRSTLRVVRWLSRMYDVRWRRNPDSFHSSFARRTGFRRNYEATSHDKYEVSNTDRLVHMTWNALTYAFESGSNLPQCSGNATVVLEDDLLPAHDMIHYFSFGLAIMERDETVKVVSAWNDNSFNIRQGLECAVQRGEHFMSLGWLTTRRIYDIVISGTNRWPTVDHGEDKYEETADMVLAIKGGWETPLLKLFHERGVGLFPVVNRVMHQKSEKGWSTTGMVQQQLLDPLSFKQYGPACSFRDAVESQYDLDLTREMLSAHWIDSVSTRCFRQLLLSVQEGQTFVVALKETDNGWSDDFKLFLAPFSWIMGYGKVRGSYKDLLLVHVAQHLLILLGPRSQLAMSNFTIDSNFRKFAMPREDAIQFFNESCDSTTIDDNPVPPPGEQAIMVGLAGPLQSCDTYCAEAGRRVCMEWSAVYSNIGRRVRRGKVALNVVRPESPTYTITKGAVGHIIPHDNWADLPVLDDSDGSVELGLPRLFRCSAPAKIGRRRICPCLNASFARLQSGRSLFVDSGLYPALSSVRLLDFGPKLASARPQFASGERLSGFPSPGSPLDSSSQGP